MQNNICPHNTSGLNCECLLGLLLFLHCLDVFLWNGSVLSQDRPEVVPRQRLLLQKLLHNSVNCFPADSNTHAMSELTSDSAVKARRLPGSR